MLRLENSRGGHFGKKCCVHRLRCAGRSWVVHRVLLAVPGVQLGLACLSVGMCAWLESGWGVGPAGWLHPRMSFEQSHVARVGAGEMHGSDVGGWRAQPFRCWCCIYVCGCVRVRSMHNRPRLGRRLAWWRLCPARCWQGLRFGTASARLLATVALALLSDWPCATARRCARRAALVLARVPSTAETSAFRSARGRGGRLAARCR